MHIWGIYVLLEDVNAEYLKSMAFLNVPRPAGCLSELHMIRSHPRPSESAEAEAAAACVSASPAMIVTRTQV